MATNETKFKTAEERLKEFKNSAESTLVISVL